jgi:hypothetical protein
MFRGEDVALSFYCGLEAGSGIGSALLFPELPEIIFS